MSATTEDPVLKVCHVCHYDIRRSEYPNTGIWLGPSQCPSCGTDLYWPPVVLVDCYFEQNHRAVESE